VGFRKLSEQALNSVMAPKVITSAIAGSIFILFLIKLFILLKFLESYIYSNRIGSGSQALQTVVVGGVAIIVLRVGTTA
jgi:hypothetical protein